MRRYTRYDRYSSPRPTSSASVPSKTQSHSACPCVRGAEAGICPSVTAPTKRNVSPSMQAMDISSAWRNTVEQSSTRELSARPPAIMA